MPDAQAVARLRVPAPAAAAARCRPGRAAQCFAPAPHVLKANTKVKPDVSTIPK